MADHLWFIPVSAGVASFTDKDVGQANYLNVQWASDKYPITSNPARVGQIFFNIFTPEIGTPLTNTTARLTGCYAQWNWISAGCNSTIQLGAQLNVGTVFGADLCGLEYVTADVFAKFRINETDRLSWAELLVNDDAGNLLSGTGNLIGAGPVDNTWFVACLEDIALDGEQNLRVMLTFLNTLTVANTGITTVDIEWFAVRLREA